MPKIALVAPIPAIRAGLHSLLGLAEYPGEAENRLEITYEAGSLLDFLEDNPPVDLLIVVEEALANPELREIASAYEGRLAVLFLGEDPGAAPRLSRLPLRAWGVLPLDASGDELFAAALALQEGLLVGAPALLRAHIARPLVSADLERDDPIEALTEREAEVLQQLARGLANKQIALGLGISEHTVKFHLSSIYAKLGVANRAEAVRAGIQRGLVSL